MNKPLLGAVLALLHITPVVVLVKREDAVKTILPTATAFTAREIHLSGPDAHRLHEALDWGPDDGRLTFYTGRSATAAVGSLTFVRVDTPHGPLEVAVGFEADGTVRRVEVTKATVETKAWVLEAVRSGVLDGYAGLKSGTGADLQAVARTPALPGGAESYRGKVGQMAGYMLEQIDRGVRRALVSYGWFYRTNAG
jgi:hypothetical protein